jgi:uncharacterized protein (TIGR03435 family)
MIRPTVAAAMAAGMVCAAFGQSAATPLSFEVASIKPDDGKMMVRLHDYPGRLDYRGISLKLLIQRAYGVQSFQISGPDWMASTRFDIEAKLPADTPKSNVPEMLQSLLTERFKVAVHRETKELPMYVLVVGKNGPKMKESEAEPHTPPGPTAAPGAKAVPAGWFMNNRPGQVQAHTMNMASLVNMLGALLGSPVVDQTGLNGTYDFDLDYTPDEVQRMSPAGVPPPPGGGEGQVPSAGNPNADGVSLLAAVQSQLGLKLDAKKGPVELIVVDHIEKTPTEN